MKTTRLNRKIIKSIVKLRKKDIPWQDIAAKIGVSDRTLQRWRERGKKEKRGIYYELDVALTKADADLIEKYAASVHNEATEGKVTTITRVVNGETTITETRQESPNASLALKRLQSKRPDEYSETKRHEHKIDWREHVESNGKDAEKIEKALAAYLATREDDDADDTE